VDLGASCVVGNGGARLRRKQAGSLSGGLTSTIQQEGQDDGVHLGCNARAGTTGGGAHEQCDHDSFPSLRMTSSKPFPHVVAAAWRMATPVLLVCLVVGAAIVAQRAFRANRESGVLAVTEVGDWRRYMIGGSIVGPPLAPVLIVTFSDFRCPSCARLAERLDSLQLMYGDSVAVVHRHLPVGSLHPYSRDAARASICADRQGAFKAYHDRLFRLQQAIGSIPWTVLASDVGVADTVSFQDCLASTVPDELISQDSIAASSLNIGRTPHLLLNGRLIAGAPAFRTLDSLTKEALAKDIRSR
jgi:predicted DsbA family dithiol-disulfide isomerase